MKNSFQLKHSAWYKDSPVTYNFPGNWDISMFTVKESPVLSSEQIVGRIENPVGAERISVMARPGMKVLIITDDIVRPSRTDIVLPILIDLLIGNGIRKEDISILISSGTHSLMTREEMVLKFGKEITDNFPVYTHDYSKNNKYIGKTSQATPVYINKRIVQSDLVIGVGGIYPHDPAGFGGGAKLILGVSGISTILHFHRKRSGTRMGGDITNDFRRDVSDAARLAHLDFIVNMIINGDREIIELVAGDTEKAFHEGIQRARELLSVPAPEDNYYDLIIADVYPIDSTYAFMRKGWWPVWSASGDCFRLVIASMPKGPGGHMLFPSKGDPRKNKLILQFYEFRALGITYILNKTVIPKLKKIFRKILSRVIPEGKKPIVSGNSNYKKSGVDTSELAILHFSEGRAKELLCSFPHRFFDDPDKYIKYISEITNGRPLKVALYKNSSLTFPLNEDVSFVE